LIATKNKRLPERKPFYYYMVSKFGLGSNGYLYCIFSKKTLNKLNCNYCFYRTLRPYIQHNHIFQLTVSKITKGYKTAL